MNSKINLLLFEKDANFFNLIKQTREGSRFEIYYMDPSHDLLTFIKDNAIKVVVIDAEINPEEAKSVLKTIRSFDAFLDIIVQGDPCSSDDVMEFINLGARDYLDKPLDRESLVAVLRKIVQIRDLRKDTFELERVLEKNYSFHGIVGKSPDMLEIFSLIEKIAPYFSSILVTGETGTGKELIAQAIHKLSRVENPKLVVCDLATIQDNLFESELFGHVRGAFTGADEDRVGLFQSAHQGTIFLDEIGEVPIHIQAKLLRILEQHTFRPLGSNDVKTIDVRVIAATNRDLKEDIKQGLFREDLYHRLNKVVIHLPRLRDRPEDIPLLVRHFLEDFSKKFGKVLRGASREVQRIFQRHNWPGNIRDLKNVLERAAILTDKEFIDVVDLPEEFQKIRPDERSTYPLEYNDLRPLADIERDYIIHVLKRTDNNLRQAARTLQVARNTLYNKIKKYDIPYE